MSPTLHVTILLSIMSDDIDTKYNSVSDQLTNPQDPVYDSECEHTESAEEESPTYDPIEEPMCTRYDSDIIGNTTPTHTPQAPVLPVYDHQMEPSESYSDGDLEHDPPINTDSEMSHDDALEQPEAKEHSADMSTNTSHTRLGRLSVASSTDVELVD